MKKFIHIQLIGDIINSDMPNIVKFRLFRLLDLKGLQKQDEANKLMYDWTSEHSKYSRPIQWLEGYNNDFIFLRSLSTYLREAKKHLSPQMSAYLEQKATGNFKHRTFYDKHYSYGVRAESHKPRDYKFKEYIKKTYPAFFEKPLIVYEAAGSSSYYREQEIIFPFQKSNLAQETIDFFEKYEYSAFSKSELKSNLFSMNIEKKELQKRMRHDFEKANQARQEINAKYQLPALVGKEGTLNDLLKKNEFVFAKIKDSAVYLHVDYKQDDFLLSYENRQPCLSYNHITDGSKKYNLVISNATSKTVIPIEFRGNWLINTLLAHFATSEKEVAKQTTCDFPKNIQLSPIFEVKETAPVAEFRAFERHFLGNLYDYVLSSADLATEYHANTIEEARVGLINKLYIEQQERENTTVKIKDLPELLQYFNYSYDYLRYEPLHERITTLLKLFLGKTKIVSEHMIRTLWRKEVSNDRYSKKASLNLIEAYSWTGTNIDKTIYYKEALNVDTVCDCIFRPQDFHAKIAEKEAFLNLEAEEQNKIRIAQASKDLTNIKESLTSEKANIVVSFEFVNKKFGWCRPGVTDFCETIGIEVKPISLADLVSKITPIAYDKYRHYLTKLF